MALRIKAIHRRIALYVLFLLAAFNLYRMTRINSAPGTSRREFRGRAVRGNTTIVEPYGFFHDDSREFNIAYMIPENGWDYVLPEPGHLKPLYGFSRCSHLDGSIFDMSVLIKTETLKKVAEFYQRDDHYDIEYIRASELSEEIIIELIDTIAWIYRDEIHGLLNFRRVKTVGDDPLRNACFMAADGENKWGRYVGEKRKFLRFVEKNLYFGDLDFYPQGESLPVNMDAVEFEAMEQAMGSQWRSDTAYTLPDSGRRGTKIAYFILGHKNFDRIRSIVELLVSDESLILIQIDSRKSDLKTKLESWIESSKFSARVRVMKQSFVVTWGAFTMVKAQIAGFFELMDWSDEWEYVSNISGDDLPLKTPKEMMNILSTFPAGTNHIQPHEDGDGDSADIQRRMVNGFAHVRKDDLDSLHEFASGIRPLKFRRVASGDAHKHAIVKTLQSQHFGSYVFPFLDWQLRKQHQWMTLHRKFIEYLRQSPTAAYVMAAMEFEFIADEHYFLSLITNIRAFSNTINPSAMRRIVFPPSAAHPTTWSSRDPLHKQAIQEQRRSQEFFFSRKVRLEDEWHRGGLIRVAFPDKWEQFQGSH